MIPIVVYLVCTMICYTTLSYQKYRLNNSVQANIANQLKVVHQANPNIGPDGRNKKIYSSKILLEMVQAFGDILKNTAPQHLWLF